MKRSSILVKGIVATGFILLATLSFASSVLAAESKDPLYFEYREGIKSYTFIGAETRQRTFDNYYPNAPKAWRDLLLDPNWGTGHYYPYKGHVGLFIGNNRSLGETESKAPLKVMIRTGDNIAMVAMSSLKLSNKEAYDQFMAERKGMASELYGLSLGESTLSEVKAHLDAEGMTVSDISISKDGLDITNVTAAAGPLMPAPYDVAADKIIFSIMDDRLWSIAVVFNEGTANKIAQKRLDVGESDPVFEFFKQAIRGKYQTTNSKPGHESPYALLDERLVGTTFWINDKKIIYLADNIESVFKIKPSDPGYVINYLDTEVHEKVLKLLEEKAQKAEEEARQKKARAEQAAKQDFQSQI